MRAVALDPDGIDVAALESAPRRRHQPTLAHIIPNFQNPAGYTLSAPKREAAARALAGAHGFVIFEDDPYVAILDSPARRWRRY